MLSIQLKIEMSQPLSYIYYLFMSVSKKIFLSMCFREDNYNTSDFQE